MADKTKIELLKKTAWYKCEKISGEGNCGENCPELQKGCCPAIEAAIEKGIVTAKEVKENAKFAIDKILGRTR